MTAKSVPASAASLEYPFPTRPERGEMLQVAPGVHWVRMAIPIPGLEFINLWAIEDGEGWTIVDTGLRSAEIRNTWERIFGELFGGKPVTRIICTHFHPDHLGQAGWLTERWKIDLWMTLGEWTFGRMLALEASETVPEEAVDFYRRHGIDEIALDGYKQHGFNNFAKGVTTIPRTFRRISDDDVLEIGGQHWRVIIGRGHSPEHACLHCPALGVLISGDQILPRITPHIGVYPGEPLANPLKQYLESLPLFRPLPADTLVLPAHGDPFRGLHQRLDQLSHHHDARLLALDAACAEPATALDLVPVLFRRKLEREHVFMALSETLAHLHLLVGDGRLESEREAGGLVRFRRNRKADAAA